LTVGTRKTGAQTPCRRSIVATALPAVSAPTGATRRPGRASAVAAKNQPDNGGASCRNKADVQ
jgi:hypothetical protein